MKNFRRLCFAVVLIGAFTMPALAGIIHTPGAPAPGETQGSPGEIPTPPSAAGETHGPGVTASGDISTPGFLATLLALLSLG